MTGLLARKSSASDALPAPGDGELHLWFCHLEQVASSEFFAREVLSRYAGVAPADLRFVKGPCGKPALLFPQLSIAFNLSHSGNRMVLVISGGCAVGVDLEYCDPARDVEKLARRFFSETELRQLRACAGAGQLGRFYDYWTLKEAAIKAGGGSLGRELEATTFDLSAAAGPTGERHPGGITAHSPAVSGRAWFGLLQPIANYRLAICCLAAADFSCGIRQFVWPHLSPEAHPPRLLARSAACDTTAGSGSL